MGQMLDLAGNLAEFLTFGQQPPRVYKWPTTHLPSIRGAFLTKRSRDLAALQRQSDLAAKLLRSMS